MRTGDVALPAEQGKHKTKKVKTPQSETTVWKIEKRD